MIVSATSAANSDFFLCGLSSTTVLRGVARLRSALQRLTGYADQGRRRYAGQQVPVMRMQQPGITDQRRSRSRR